MLSKSVFVSAKLYEDGLANKSVASNVIAKRPIFLVAVLILVLAILTLFVVLVIHPIAFVLLVFLGICSWIDFRYHDLLGLFRASILFSDQGFVSRPRMKPLISLNT